MQVVIIGGGMIGYFLAQSLLANKHLVTIIEKEEDRCNGIVKELNAVVINGDGTNIQTLVDAEVEKADVVVALTGRDQDNLVACQLAHQRFHVPRTIARVSNPKNKELLEKLGGVNIALSTTGIISTLVQEEVSIEDVITLLTFKEGEVAMVETEVRENSPAKGKAIMDLNLPQDCVIISIVRGNRTIFPRGSTILKAKDKVLALTTNKNKASLQGILVRREE